MQPTILFDVPVHRFYLAGEEYLAVRAADLKGMSLPAPPAAVTSIQRQLTEGSFNKEVAATLRDLGPATLNEIYDVLQADDVRCNKSQVSSSLSYMRAKGLVHYDRNTHRHIYLGTREVAA